MLLRQENGSVLLISQPAHAWVTGQLARHWGNQHFPALSEEVCLAAEQHDIGFLPWDEEPTLNSGTGLPHSFLDLPVATHMDLWTRGIQKMLRFGRYPALIVSRHFTSLARRIVTEREGNDRAIVAEFLKRQETLQSRVITSLRADVYYSKRSTEEQIRSDQETVSLLDWISLQVLLNFGEERIARELNFRPGAANFKLTQLSDSGDKVGIAPWPFNRDDVRLVCDARRLYQSYSDETQMRAALRNANPVAVAVELVSTPGDELP